MKNSKMMKILSLVLLVAMIGMILVSGTYAKYTTEVTGTATATVAKFSVSSSVDTSFDLFSTIKEADASSEETDVSTGKIAPGTGGSFDITVENDSEVTVSYKLTVKETSNKKNVPIEYSTDGKNYAAADTFSKEADLAIGSGEQTVTIYWRWAFEGDGTTQSDESDTTIGEAAATETTTVEVTASVVFTQED